MGTMKPFLTGDENREVSSIKWGGRQLILVVEAESKARKYLWYYFQGMEYLRPEKIVEVQPIDRIETIMDYIIMHSVMLQKEKMPVNILMRRGYNAKVKTP